MIIVWDGKPRLVVEPSFLVGPLHRDIEVHILRTSCNEEIPGFLYRHREARFTIIYAHGNATDCGAMHDRYKEMVENLKVNLFAFEYTGYGTSTGIPSEQATYSDIQAAYDYLVDHVCREPKKEIVLYGQSVGSGPVCKLAKEFPVSGMILHSPIMSGMRVLTDSRVLGCLDIYPNIDRIKKVNSPVMIIHGREDEEVGWDHGVGLHEAVPPHHQTNPWWVAGCGHNNICDTEEVCIEYYRRISAFLKEIETRNVAHASYGTSR